MFWAKDQRVPPPPPPPSPSPPRAVRQNGHTSSGFKENERRTNAVKLAPADGLLWAARAHAQSAARPLSANWSSASELKGQQPPSLPILILHPPPQDIPEHHPSPCETKFIHSRRSLFFPSIARFLLPPPDLQSSSSSRRRSLSSISPWDDRPTRATGAQIDR